MEYNFTLRYRIGLLNGSLDALVDRLAEAGCDDALIGMGQPGRLALEFSREAASAQAAVHSALQDVQRAMPAACLIEAAPDYVGLTDVAEMLGMSRQNMRKLMLAYPESFPSPVHEGKTSIWRLYQVLEWLNAKGGYAIDASTLDVARAVFEINIAKDDTRSALDARARRGLRAELAGVLKQV